MHSYFKRYNQPTLTNIKLMDLMQHSRTRLLSPGYDSTIKCNVWSDFIDLSDYRQFNKKKLLFKSKTGLVHFM